MYKNIAGIEIGGTRIKIVQVKGGKIEKFSVFDLPEGVSREEIIRETPQAKEFLKNVLKKEMKIKKAALVMADNETILQKMTLKENLFDSEEKMKNITLPFQFHSTLTKSDTDYYFDYAIFKEIPEEASYEIQAVAVQKDILDNYKKAFKSAGISLIKAEPRVLAQGDLVREYLANEPTVAILDISHQQSHIDIYQNGVYEITRSIDLGIREIIDKVSGMFNCSNEEAFQKLKNNEGDIQNFEDCLDLCEEIASDVMQTLDFYAYSNQNVKLDKLYYCGGGSWYKPLLDTIANRIEEELIPLSQIQEDENVKEGLSSGPATIGITLR